MTVAKNQIIPQPHSKPIVVDTFFTKDNKAKPIVIFCHGYKGFKDWGAWNLMAESFAKAGFFFIKFNFSHNGGTIENPIDFPDLEAFGNNNYTKELDDLKTVIDWIYTSSVYKDEIDINNISLIGHSRGGGIVCIKAEEDQRITKLITLAGVSDYGSRSSTTGDLEQWEKDGVKFIINGRTKQKMPHYYQFYTNFIENEKRLTIQRAVKNLKIPFCIIHGDGDTSVAIQEAKNLHQWNSNSELFIIEKANHVFGTKHPWEEKKLPKDLKITTDKSIEFLKTT